MTKELAEARADARAAQDRANRAEEALREIVKACAPATAAMMSGYTIRHEIRGILDRHGVNLGGDQ